MAGMSERNFAVVTGLLTCLAIAPALAVAQPATRSSANADTLRQRDQELETLRAQQRKAVEAEKSLRVEIDELGADRRKLNQALIDTAAKVREGEAKLSTAEGRMKSLEEKEQALRTSLEGRRTVMAEVLAALQRIGRQPPPALLVRPEDALQSVRTAILLGAVLPDMRERARVLTADLTELVWVRTGIADEKVTLTRDLASLTSEQTRMNLLVEQRQRREADAQKELDAQHAQAIALSRQADGLKDLIARLERDLDPAARAARAALRADEDRKDKQASLAALKDPGRMTPALAFASARKLLPMPVAGTRIRDYGAADGLGGSEKGISLATRPEAQVTSPCDGWVVYAGPFRSYGQLLILNAGGGYHVVLAGMERISVDLGQFVLTGEPVALMGTSSQVASSEPTGASQPVLYVEFRKDGVPVDSGPWWATQEGEKVRG